VFEFLLTLFFIGILSMLNFAIFYAMTDDIKALRVFFACVFFNIVVFFFCYVVGG